MAKKHQKRDVVIIGAGMAGLTAALYAGRSGLSVLVLESELVGGQIANAAGIENYPGVPGHPDIAITKYKIAVFCDSAFFHGKDYETRKKPETNADFWKKKIERNMERDREVNKALQEIGWTVIRFWDDDINKRLDECVEAVKEAVFKRSVR